MAKKIQFTGRPFFLPAVSRMPRAGQWWGLSLVTLALVVAGLVFQSDAQPAVHVSEEPAEVAMETVDQANAAVEAPSYLEQGVADIMWLVLTAYLVMFMQAGFSLLESGLTRAKNTVNIMTKNLMDFCLACLIYWAFGYALMYGEQGNAFIGWDPDLLFLGSANSGQDDALSAAWLFQVVFAGTAATIVSGAMAERTKLGGYMVYAAMIIAILYPITGYWIWGSNGWLASMGMRDFAGSTVVHSVGAWAALVGAYIVGPRKGKYREDGKVNVFPGHNMAFATIGVLILWFGWYGFNPGSTLAAVDGISHVAVTTTLSAAAGGLFGLSISWIRTGYPDLTMGLNGVVAGLVAITAPCASVSTLSAVIIGAVAGVLVYFSANFIDRTMKIDDPVGAISAHGTCGAWGTIAVGLFGERAIDVRFWDEETAIQNGLFFGGGASQLVTQCIGVLAVLAFSLAVAAIIFNLAKFTIGLRASDEDQEDGLDISEHGMEAYPEFKPYDT